MELHTYLEILKRRKWIVLGLFAFLLLSIALIFYLFPPKYSTAAKLRVLTPKNGGTNYVDFNVYYATRLMNTYTSLATSTSVQNELMQTLKLSEAPDVTVNVIADSELIKITANARTPELSAKIANTLADILVSHSKEAAAGVREITEKATTDRLTMVSNELDTVRKEYQQLAVPISKDNVRIAALRNQIDYDQRLAIILAGQYEVSVQSLPKESPLLASLADRIAKLNAQISKEQTELDALSLKVAEESSQLTFAQAKVTLREQEYTDLVFQLDQVSTIQELQNGNLLDVVDRASPQSSQSSPSVLFIYLIGAVISLFLAILAAFVVDNLDDTVHSTAQIETLLESSALGKITTVQQPEQGLQLLDGMAYEKDAGRLQLALHRISKTRSLKSLILSNVQKQHREPVLEVILAREYARTGLKVVVMDTDFEMPSLHKLFPTARNESGLNQLLTDSMTVNQVIQETDQEDLFIITTGPSLTNPGYYLGLDQMRDLLGQLQEDFAIVILHTAPILTGNDTDDLVALVDGVILVVERGKAQRRDIRAAIKRLTDLEAPLLGYVISQAETD